MNREEMVQIFRENRKFYYDNEEKIRRLIKLTDIGEYIELLKKTREVKVNILFERRLEEEMNKNQIERK